jgi:hypothetical protein
VILRLPRLAAARRKACSVISSTAARLSQEMQISTSLVSCASAIRLGVNCRNLSWVSSMTWIVSDRTMQAAVRR